VPEISTPEKITELDNPSLGGILITMSWAELKIDKKDDQTKLNG